MVTIALTLWLVIGLPLSTVSWEQNLLRCFALTGALPFGVPTFLEVTEYSALSGVAGLLFFCCCTPFSWRRGSGRRCNWVHMFVLLCVYLVLLYIWYYSFLLPRDGVTNYRVRDP